MIRLAIALSIVAPQGDVRSLVSDLGAERQHGRRLAAYRTLMKRKPPAAIPLLVERLPTWRRNSQDLAIMLLRMYPRDASIPALRRIVARDRSPLLTCRAAIALARLGRRDYASQIAATLKSGKLAGADLSLVASRLSGIRHPEVRDAVRAAMLRPTAPLPVVTAALNLLFDDERSATTVAALKDHPQTKPAVRAMCLAYLVAKGDNANTSALAQAFESGDAQLTRMSGMLLRATSLDDVVIKAIIARIRATENPAQLLAGIRLLGKYGGARGLPALRELTKSRVKRVATSALESLTKITNALKPKDLMRMLGSEPAVALIAADALRRMDDLSGFPRVLEIVATKGSDKAEAVRVLGRFRARKSVPPLIEALADPQRPVRAAAYSALNVVLPALLPYRRVRIASTGYSVDATDETRATAVHKLRTWWRRVEAR